MTGYVVVMVQMELIRGCTRYSIVFRVPIFMGSDGCICYRPTLGMISILRYCFTDI